MLKACAFDPGYTPVDDARLLKQTTPEPERWLHDREYPAAERGFVPVVVSFAIFQKYFVTGLTGGAIKS